MPARDAASMSLILFTCVTYPSYSLRCTATCFSEMSASVGSAKVCAVYDIDYDVCVMQKSSMEDSRLLWMRAVALFVCVVTLGVLWLQVLERRVDGACDTKRLCVAFLDVGQGDATFIRSPSGQTMLVDGGRDAQVLSELPKVMPGMTHHIDYVAGTHPDADHIGGLAQVVMRYAPAHALTIASNKETAETRELG